MILPLYNSLSPLGLGRSAVAAATALPLLLRLHSWLGLYKDVECTIPATEEGDLIAAWQDELSGNGGKLIQSDPARRPALVFVDSKPVVAPDGSNDCFEDWVPPEGITSLVTAHALNTTQTGYFNVFDRIQAPGKIRPECWIDPSGRVELNGFSGSPIVSSPIIDGATRRLITHHSMSGAGMWINGTHIGQNSVSVEFAAMPQLNRGGSNTFKGHLEAIMYAADIPPGDANIAALDALLALAA